MRAIKATEEKIQSEVVKQISEIDLKRVGINTLAHGLHKPYKCDFDEVKQMAKERLGIQ